MDFDNNINQNNKNEDDVINQENGEKIADDFEHKEIDDEQRKSFVQEPTVTFEAIKSDKEEGTSLGIKVFFAMLGVTVMLVAAVAVGYIFGISKSEDLPQYNLSTSLQNKSESVFSDNATVYNNLSMSVVSIVVYNSTEISSSASGVVYTSDGYIITNDHIYSSVSSPKFVVRFADGTEYDAEFVAGDTRSDLAVLKIDAKNLKPATFGNYNEVITGEPVVAMGYPSGAGVEPIFTSGTISAKGTRVTGSSSYSVKMIQTDTPINPGNSGGALVNMYSQVIGITSVKLVGSQYDSVGYAIPSSTVVSVVDSLIENGFVKGRGKLGITYSEIDTVSSKIQNLPTGLLIQSVSTDSDFYGKNLKQGDIITHINDTVITRSDIALDIIDSTNPSESITITVYHTSTGVSEKIYGMLIPDEGSSSYTTEIIKR